MTDSVLIFAFKYDKMKYKSQNSSSVAYFKIPEKKGHHHVKHAK